MPDLQYDLELLREFGATLTRIADDLHHDKRLAEHGVDDLAHRDVVDAVRDFVDDWDDKRRKLTQRVESLGSMASDSAERLDEADRELARALREASKS